MKLLRQCPVCGTPYEADPVRLKHGRQTTCSRACSYTLRQREATRATTIPCAVCGVPVTRPPSQVKSKAGLAFCSPDCHYKARTLGLVPRKVTAPYRVPPATRLAQAGRMREVNAARKAAGRYGCPPAVRAKISISVAKAIADGRLPRVSALERDVGEVLRALGVNALPQEHFRDARGRFGAAVDFFLPGYGVVLEVNGTFWHADPRVYPAGPQHPSQKRVAAQYARKVRFLDGLGIPVVELWELDFKADPEGSVRAALGL